MSDAPEPKRRLRVEVCDAGRCFDRGGGETLLGVLSRMCAADPQLADALDLKARSCVHRCQHGPLLDVAAEVAKGAAEDAEPARYYAVGPERALAIIRYHALGDGDPPSPW